MRIKEVGIEPAAETVTTLPFPDDDTFDETEPIWTSGCVKIAEKVD